jgi:hypothetical protein
MLPGNSLFFLNEYTQNAVPFGQMNLFPAGT